MKSGPKTQVVSEIRLKTYANYTRKFGGVCVGCIFLTSKYTRLPHFSSTYPNFAFFEALLLALENIFDPWKKSLPRHSPDTADASGAIVGNCVRS